MGVLLEMSAGGDATSAANIGKQIAMHITASNPSAVDRGSLDPAFLAKEREIVTLQAQASGKPSAIVEKMVEGRMIKLYEAESLLEQPFIMDTAITVGDYLKKKSDELGYDITVVRFKRFAIGA